MPNEADTASKTAVVAYIPPQPASTYTVWCLEEVGRVPILAHLLKRLRLGFSLPNLTYIVACHDENIEKRIGNFPDLTEVVLFRSCRSNKAKLLAHLCEAEPEIATLLVFPAHAIFPDCKLILEMLAAHREKDADATFSQDYPVGLVPEIFEARAIKRLANLDLPAELSSDCLSVMRTAKRLSGNDPGLHFRILSFVSADASGPQPERLPRELLVNDYQKWTAAHAVVRRLRGNTAFDSTEAYAFKEELLSSEPQLELASKGLSESRVVPAQVLFCSYVGAFSGAEESLYILIRHLDTARYRPIVLLPLRSVLSEKLQAAGIPVEISRNDFKRVTPYNLALLDNLLLKHQIRLVHINGLAGPAILAAAAYRGIPVIHHIRAFDMCEAQDLMKFSARIVAISDAIALDLRRCDLRSEKIIRIYNGIDLATFDPQKYNGCKLRNELAIPLDHHVICMMARISQAKRQHFLLEALPAVLGVFPKTMVAFVGETYPDEVAYQEYLRGFVQKQGLEQQVRFWGFREDIASVYSVADALILCTRKEPFGRCILEAWAMGVPVITPNEAGPAEIVSHNADGLLYDASQPGSLAQCVVNLFSNDELRARLVLNGLRRVKVFDAKHSAAQVQSLYDELLIGPFPIADAAPSGFRRET